MPGAVIPSGRKTSATTRAVTSTSAPAGMNSALCGRTTGAPATAMLRPFGSIRRRTARVAHSSAIARQGTVAAPCKSISGLNAFEAKPASALKGIVWGPAQARERLDSETGVELRKRRSVEVESVWGQIKHDRSLRRFLTRGLAKVKTEWGLLALAHNMLKVTALRAGG